MTKKILFFLTIFYLILAQADTVLLRPDAASLNINDPVIEETIKKLKEQLKTEKNQQAQSKIAFALGVFYFKTNHSDESLDYFLRSLELGTRLGDYAHFFVGMIFAANKDLPEAKRHFQAVVQFTPQSVRKAEAELQLAKLAKDEEKWGEAIQYLRAIEKKYRRQLEHPEILYSIFEAAKARHLDSEACAAAVKLYDKYPMVTVEKGWNEDLSSIHCSVQFRDQEKRFDQFLLIGELDRLKEEIKFWTEKTRSDGGAHPKEFSFYETQLGKTDLAEGKIQSAIQHFMTAQDMVGRNFQTQMLLAKAYSQTEDYSAAIEAYLHAHELSPYSKQGQQALFQAAFLSYQNLDYDGASRRFEELAKKTRGRLLFDTKWHLAWIRYLKEDYEGAVKAFTEMAAQKKLQSVDAEKLAYWRGMSLLRLGFTEDARTIFKNLASEKRLGYYTAVAQARLLAMPAERKQPELIDPNAPRIAVIQQDPQRKPAQEDDSLKTDTPSETKNEEEGSVESQVAGPDDEEQPTEEPVVTNWKDPLLALRFDRARDLRDLGFDQWARAELREIEKRTRNQVYLQLLMSEYAKVGEYNRSAYIADVAFSSERETLGLNGGGAFWLNAFPRAYENFVTINSKKFEVPQSFVWSVMRGESAFRADIHSPAGALGLMQLIPKTGKKIAENLKVSGFQNSMLLDPNTNIMFGTWYLKRLTKAMAQNIPLVVASYNAGPHRVLGWVKQFGKLDMDEFIEHIPYLETRNYVKKILRNYYVYQTIYDKKGNMPWLAQKLTFKYDGPKPVAENWDE